LSPLRFSFICEIVITPRDIASSKDSSGELSFENHRRTVRACFVRKETRRQHCRMLFARVQQRNSRSAVVDYALERADLPTLIPDIRRMTLRSKRNTDDCVASG
jgi:hypothetical protein